MANLRPLGAILSPPDPRDYTLSVVTATRDEFPDSYLIPGERIVTYDQGATSMCVAFVLRLIKEVQERAERNKFEMWSAGFIYGNREDDDYQGEGMQVREALSQLRKFGVCEFNLLTVVGTYKECRDAIETNKPKLLQHAFPQHTFSYLRLQDIDEIKTALMDIGPVIVALPVYPSFDEPEHIIDPDRVIDPDDPYDPYESLKALNIKDKIEALQND